MAPFEGWHPWAQPSYPFLAANRADSSSKCSRDSLASSSQNCSKDGHQKGSWVRIPAMPQKFHYKNFFSHFQKCKLWVCSTSIRGQSYRHFEFYYSRTIVQRYGRSYDSTTEGSFGFKSGFHASTAAALEHVSVINAMPLQGLQAHLSHHIARCKLSMHTIS